MVIQLVSLLKQMCSLSAAFLFRPDLHVDHPGFMFLSSSGNLLCYKRKVRCRSPYLHIVFCETSNQHQALIGVDMAALTRIRRVREPLLCSAVFAYPRRREDSGGLEDATVNLPSAMGHVERSLN
ncbi:hypothetical protein M3J07_011000 [Ascochyta lentis]